MAQSLISSLIIATFLVIATNILPIEARRLSGEELLEIPTIPVPEIPATLPHIPDLPKHELPPLPHLPNPELPHLPNPELPHHPKVPEFPKFPEFPSVHFPELPKLPFPAIPTLPKEKTPEITP